MGVRFADTKKPVAPGFLIRRADRSVSASILASVAPLVKVTFWLPRRANGDLFRLFR